MVRKRLDRDVDQRLDIIPEWLRNSVCRRSDEMELGCEEGFEFGFPSADVGEEFGECGMEVGELSICCAAPCAS